MNNVRDCTDGRERAGAAATTDFAAQCWDKTNWQGNNKRTDDSKLTTIDMGFNDIYNTNRGNHELNHGNDSLQNAEDKINKVVDKLIDGSCDTKSLVKMLNKSDKSLDGATDDYMGAIRHLGASATKENLGDMVNGRLDVKDADKKVQDAITQLNAGDRDGAIQSLLQSLGKIDSAQKEMRDSKTDADDCKDGGKKNTDDFRPGDRTSRNDGRMHDHMYRGGRVYAGGSPYFDESSGGYMNNNDYGRTDAGMWNSNGQDSRVLNVVNPLGENDQIIWDSNSMRPSRIRLSNPIGGGSTTIDLDKITETGDKIAAVVDPGHLLPNASDLSDPGKLTKKILDPFDLF